MKVLTNGATLERTLDVNFEKGDLDYDNDYDINDYMLAAITIAEIVPPMIF